ncbi:MAG: hypothetical protein KY395_06445, partial [Actinobacteria bacterium]|nr:hypothetical protein [Actinomycetota bacterium]
MSTADQNSEQLHPEGDGRPTDGRPRDGDWRGVATESVEDVTGSLAAFLRGRSKRLLGSLLSPHRRTLMALGALILVEEAMALAGPYLIKVAIDSGIPPLAAGGSARPLITTCLLFLGAILVQQVALR